MKFHECSYLAALCLSLLAGSAMADGLVGFWDFKDGKAGENVREVVNSVGESKWTGVASARTNGGEVGLMPSFDSDSPGLYIRSSATGEILAENPQSIKFGYDPALINPDRTSAPPGGRIDFAGIVDELAGSAFTIEFFIKMDENFEYYSPKSQWVYNSKSACFFGENPDSGTIRGFKLIAPNGVQTNKVVTGLALEVFDQGQATVGISNDGTWRHIAIVCDGNGTIRYYCNYAESAKGSLAYDNSSYSGTKVFRLGSGRSYEEMQGSISCLRITKKALGKDGFMRVDNSPPITTAGVVGFWDFKDGKVGESADELDNSASDGIFDGKAAPVGSQGMSPVFSADAPGRFIYADSSAKERIADSPQSLHFAPGTSSGGGGKVELANLSSSLGKIDAYTMEFFFKSETTDTYRTPIGWRLDDNVGFKVNFQSGSVGYLEAVTNNNGQFSNLDYAYLVLDSAFTADAWHHLAVVCDAAKGKMKMYVDYRSPIEIDYDARTTLESFPVTLGTSAFAKREGLEAFGGFISCPRVTARTLDIPDFMVARMVETEPGIVFAWNFEEGAGNLAEKIDKACDYADSQADSAALKDAYCIDKNTLPEYAGTSKGARRVLWGAKPMWTNSVSCYFQGRQKATVLPYYAGTEMNRPASGLPGCNPESWTMEAFVRREHASYSATYGALIFGKMGNTTPHVSTTVYPQYCWMLTQLPDGKLKLFWTQADREAYDAQSSSYKSAKTATALAADGRWHHVALVYDKPTRKFSVYVDYALAMTQTVGGEEGYELYDGSFGYYYSRMELTDGFEGWMDEIRFSSVARTPETFIRFEPVGFMMILR